MNADLLETIQETAYGVLRAAPALADAVILMDDAGDIEARVKKALGAKQEGPTGKAGLVLIVMLPEVAEAGENLPGPVCTVSLEVQAIEWATVNRTAAGTGMRSSAAALHALHALHHYVSGNLIFYPAGSPVKPLPMPAAHLSHVVTMTCRPPALQGPGKCAAPVLQTTEEDTLSLTTATPDADIYFTLDGSFPYPENPEAALYSAPIAAPEASLTLRAAAYATGLNPSDAPAFRITI